MNHQFYISISIKTADGPQPIGHFNLGVNREAATGLFKRLEGSAVVDHHAILYIEFMELVKGLPMNIDILTCDLKQLGNNCMLITQELFRVSNLEP